MELRKYTIKEVDEAIAKNGLEHIREKWIVVDDAGNVVAGCVLAQGAYNLDAIASQDALDDLGDSIYKRHDIDSHAIDWESMEFPLERYNLIDQLNRFEVPLDSTWNSPDDDVYIGDTIVYWNDKKTRSGGYLLPTYADVTKMVHDLLEPIRDETITLTVLSSWVPPTYQDEVDE